MRIATPPGFQSQRPRARIGGEEEEEEEAEADAPGEGGGGGRGEEEGEGDEEESTCAQKERVARSGIPLAVTFREGGRAEGKRKRERKR